MYLFYLQNSHYTMDYDTGLLLELNVNTVNVKQIKWGSRKKEIIEKKRDQIRRNGN